MIHKRFTTPAINPSSYRPELWGGAEYTCNRVGDAYFDQMNLSGHSDRISDYDKIYELGVRTLRVGLLWEHYEQEISWNRFDSHLQRIRDLGMRPVAGLLHHGSGPSDTHLLDPLFAEKLASYALKVAERYPWIDAYTPVNEPHTTARFSGMYGVWYPHGTSVASYLRALLHQLKGVVLSMRAIRTINHKAQLIQTDDVGGVRGTPETQPVCELMNLRRWLPYDLLYGRVDRQHPMFSYLYQAGVAEADIFWFSENPCPPDIFGLNYYVTSDRYLDHRIHLYEEERRSAEGSFVDVEAVRVLPEANLGVGKLLRESWQRYKTPIAITEVHLGATADEQIRWLAESWDAVLSARLDGINCVGLTVWALFGSFYWNQLVTRANGHYEPGVFDVRSGEALPTELATVVAQIANGKSPSHEALSTRGWWHQPERIELPFRAELAA